MPAGRRTSDAKLLHFFKLVDSENAERVAPVRANLRACKAWATQRAPQATRLRPAAHLLSEARRVPRQAHRASFRVDPLVAQHATERLLAGGDEVLFISLTRNLMQARSSYRVCHPGQALREGERHHDSYLVQLLVKVFELCALAHAFLGNKHVRM